MPDQGEAIDAERIGKREQVGDQRVGGVGGDVLRAVAVPEPAQVGHDQAEAVAEQAARRLRPGAVRFGKAVEQDDGRRVGGPASATFMRDAGRRARRCCTAHG